MKQCTLREAPAKGHLQAAGAAPGHSTLCRAGGYWAGGGGMPEYGQGRGDRDNFKYE